MLASALGPLQAPEGPRTADQAALLERFRTSPGAWLVAAALLVTAAYFIVRLLELDVINEETPNQDDPLSRPPESPGSPTS